MGKTIFIKEIITILKEPRLCPTCQKEDKLEKDMFEKKGPMEKQFSVQGVKH